MTSLTTILCNTAQKKRNHMEVLLSNFHIKGQKLGFYLQTKLESPCTTRKYYSVAFLLTHLLIVSSLVWVHCTHLWSHGLVNLQGDLLTCSLPLWWVSFGFGSRSTLGCCSTWWSRHTSSFLWWRLLWSLPILFSRGSLLFICNDCGKFTKTTMNRFTNSMCNPSCTPTFI